MMHKFILTGLLASALIIVTACDTTIDPQDGATDESTPEQIYYENDNISFYYPSLIAQGINTEIIEASKEGTFIEYPEYLQISFEDYLISERTLSPVIEIFPLEEYYLLSDDAAATIDILETIIAKKAITDNIIELPYLPWPGAAQQFYANVDFLEAKAGSGLRYLTQYSQDVAPVTNQGLFYTYQSITADQKYYISAVFPVNHSELPLDWEDYFKPNGTDYKVFEESYAGYLDLIVMMLDDAGADDFKPSLKLLDSIIESLQIKE